MNKLFKRIVDKIFEKEFDKNIKHWVRENYNIDLKIEYNDYGIRFSVKPKNNLHYIFCLGMKDNGPIINCSRIPLLKEGLMEIIPYNIHKHGKQNENRSS